MSLELVEREHVIKDVGPRAVYEVVTDYAAYPRMLPEFSGCKVLFERDATKRVEFCARVVVEVRYVLDIVHDPERLKTRWTFVEGQVVTDSEGGWEFFADGKDTRILYGAGIAIRAPLPKFVLAKISALIVGSSIPNMFRAFEEEALTRRQYAK